MASPSAAANRSLLGPLASALELGKLAGRASDNCQTEALYVDTRVAQSNTSAVGVSLIDLAASALQADHGLSGKGNANKSEDAGPDYLSSFYEKLFEHEYMKMTNDIFSYGTPVVIVIGNLSNIMALVILRRKYFQNSSVCFYLSAYAIANLCVLDLLLGVFWMCNMFQMPYITWLADWSCRLWMFVTNVLTYSGVWFVVAVSIDRLIFLVNPVKAQGYCTLFTAKAIVTFMMVGLVVVSIHAMWTYQLEQHGCYVAYESTDLHTAIWPWWSATVYSYIPLLLLLGLSMAKCVFRCFRWRRTVSSEPQNNGSSKDTFVVTVIVVAMSFFLLTVPATVVNVLDIHLPFSMLGINVIARIELTKKITETLSNVNRADLLLLMLLCSKDFRQEAICVLRSLLCCLRSPRTFRVFEMRNISNSEDSSPHIQVDYELCNNNEVIITNV